MELKEQYDIVAQTDAFTDELILFINRFIDENVIEQMRPRILKIHESNEKLLHFLDNQIAEENTLKLVAEIQDLINKK